MSTEKYPPVVALLNKELKEQSFNLSFHSVVLRKYARYLRSPSSRPTQTAYEGMLHSVLLMIEAQRENPTESFCIELGNFLLTFAKTSPSEVQGLGKVYDFAIANTPELQLLNTLISIQILIEAENKAILKTLAENLQRVVALLTAEDSGIRQAALDILTYLLIHPTTKLSLKPHYTAISQQLSRSVPQQLFILSRLSANTAFYG